MYCFSVYRPLLVMSWWKSSPCRWRIQWCPPRVHVPVSQVSYVMRPATDMGCFCSASLFSLSKALWGFPWLWPYSAVHSVGENANSGQNNPSLSCSPIFHPYFAWLLKAYILYIFLYIVTIHRKWSHQSLESFDLIMMTIVTLYNWPSLRLFQFFLSFICYW